MARTRERFIVQAASWLLCASAFACSAEGTGNHEDKGSPPGANPDANPETPGASTPGSFDPVPDAFEKPPAPLPLPQAAIDAVAAEVKATVTRAGYTRSVRVDNATTGQVLATSTPATFLKPASNTKLFTTGASLEMLGEDHPLGLKVYGTAPIGANGVLTGNLHVVSEHNFTLSTEFYPSPRTPFDRMAATLKRQGLKQITGTVTLNGEVTYEGAEFGTLDAATERTQAVGPLGDALTAAGIAHGAVSGSATFTPPAGATLLLEHAPLPLPVGESPLNTLSHNEFADTLSRHLGFVKGGQSSYAAGGKVMVDWAKSLGAPDGLSFSDGSGLSGANRVSADAVIAILKGMTGTPEGPVWKHTMAIAGVRGTVRARMTEADTKGRFFGKTGTLNDTIALSGYLENKYDGQEYVISVIQNAVGNQTTARDIADDVVRTVAKNHRKSEARPNAPVVAHVRGGAAKGVLEIMWNAVDGADGYVVWLSDTGRVWKRDMARYVKNTRFVAGDLPDVPNVYVRITAHNAAGLESDPSVTFMASPAKEHAEVLLVDANLRWMSAADQPENVMGENHDFLVALARASGAHRVDSASQADVADGKLDLSAYKAVIWAAGETSTGQQPISTAAQTVLATYLGKNGAVLFSGSELLWALDSKGSEADKTFARDVMHAGFADDAAGTFEFEGVEATDFQKIGTTSFYTPDAMRVDTPDVLNAVGGSAPLLRYLGGKGGAAVLGFKGTGRVMVTGFPVESIASGAMRKSVLDSAYTFLGVSP